MHIREEQPTVPAGRKASVHTKDFLALGPAERITCWQDLAVNSPETCEYLRDDRQVAAWLTVRSVRHHAESRDSVFGNARGLELLDGDGLWLVHEYSGVDTDCEQLLLACALEQGMAEDYKESWGERDLNRWENLSEGSRQDLLALEHEDVGLHVRRWVRIMDVMR